MKSRLDTTSRHFSKSSVEQRKEPDKYEIEKMDELLEKLIFQRNQVLLYTFLLISGGCEKRRPFNYNNFHGYRSQRDCET